MIVDTVLENCRIVTPIEILDASIAIEEGRIVQVARNPHMPSADERIDVGGKIVIPGVIDPHVHFREPGFEYKETFETGSMSAAYGGVTTVLEMPNTSPRTDGLVEYLEKSKLAMSSYIDFGLIFEVTNQNVPKINDVQPAAFKAFLDTDRIDYKGLAKAMRRVNYKTFCIHAEDFNLIKKNEKKNSSKTPETHSKIRNDEVEKKAVEEVLKLTIGTNHIHFCHLSSQKAIELVLKSRKNVSFEVTPHHLLFDTSEYKKQGNFVKVNPSLKDKKDVEWLWGNISQVNCFGSDHAPHTKDEKKDTNRTKAPSGVPGVETMLPLLINEVNKDRLTWQELVQKTSFNTSQIFELNRKGQIKPGMDADLVIIDNGLETTIREKDLHSLCGWSPYKGMKLKGGMERVMLRGESIVQYGQLMIGSGFGRSVI